MPIPPTDESAGFLGTFFIEICRGAKAAADLDIKLFILYGGYVEETTENYKYQKNNVYPLARHTDGAVVSVASICRSTWGKQDLVDMLSGTSLVTLNDSFKNVSNIRYSPDDGLPDALYYMIHFLHKKNLIFSGGPLSNNGSNHRIAIFQEVLKEDHQVFHAKQKNRQQGDLIHTFLDEAGDIDAIVCANDELAICTYDVLKKRNMKVGRDVAVLGFDDIWNAVENCVTTKMEQAIHTPTCQKLNIFLYTIYNLDFARIQDKTSFSPLFQEISELIENEDALLLGRQQICYVLRCFTENMIHLVEYTDKAEQLQADYFCDRLSHTCIRALDSGSLQKEQYYRSSNKALNIAAKRVMLFTTQNECCRNILETLRDFHVSHGSLFLFDRPLRNVCMHQLNHQIIRYAGKLDHDEIRLYSNRKLSFMDIPATVSDSDDSVTAILSLYSQEELYGYLTCDLNRITETELEFLRIHIGTALHTLTLIESIERQSETDPLTYLYNRRGFYRNVYDFLDTVTMHQQAWIIYADMNRLKTINDEYGHDEGDMAIVKGAAILKEAFPINSIIARMGGDEFLVIAGFPQSTTEADIEKIIQDKTDVINTRITRDINVSLSCGILKIDLQDHRPLDEMINDADTIMYQKKTSGRKQ